MEEHLKKLHELILQGGQGLEGITDEQKAILSADIPDEDIFIKPTGELYVPQVLYRQLLIKAFGHFGFALTPIPLPDGSFEQPKVENNEMTYKQILIIGGQYVGQAEGGHSMHQNTTHSDAVESCKSNALTRICKDLGIAWKCWDSRFCEQWKAKYAKKEWRKDKRSGKSKQYWTRKDNIRDPGLPSEQPQAATQAKPTAQQGTQMGGEQKQEQEKKLTESSMTNAQRGTIVKAARESGCTQQQFADYLTAMYGVKKLAEIPGEQVEEVLQHIKDGHIQEYLKETAVKA